MFVVKLNAHDDDDSELHGPFDTNEEAVAFGTEWFKGYNDDDEDEEFWGWESVKLHTVVKS